MVGKVIEYVYTGPGMRQASICPNLLYTIQDCSKAHRLTAYIGSYGHGMHSSYSSDRLLQGVGGDDVALGGQTLGVRSATNARVGVLAEADHLRTVGTVAERKLASVLGRVLRDHETCAPGLALNKGSGADGSGDNGQGDGDDGAHVD